MRPICRRATVTGGAAVGFLTIAQRLKVAYDEQPDQIVAVSAEVAARVRDLLAPGAGRDGLPTAQSLHATAAYYRAGFDETHGGLTGQMKFPSSLSVRMLLRHHRRTGDVESLAMATRTLEGMAAGGMRDQVGGGFHRYSTDPEWLVPHFEQMLYDNALLVPAYLEAYQVTGREDFAEVARDILRYVERDMTAPDGAFYSATDADSPGPDGTREEGLFFTWTADEIAEALDPTQARLVVAYFGVTDDGNFEGRTILHTPRSLEEVAAELGLSDAPFRQTLDAAREQLYAARAARPAPLRDDKILTAWNGLMISALAQASLVLDEPMYAARAVRAADYLLRTLRRDGRLLRAALDGAARQTAYLDDYAFLIAGLLDLYEADGDLRWLEEARALDAVLERDYEDTSGGGFFPHRVRPGFAAHAGEADLRCRGAVRQLRGGAQSPPAARADHRRPVSGARRTRVRGVWGAPGRQPGSSVRDVAGGRLSARYAERDRAGGVGRSGRRGAVPGQAAGSVPPEPGF